jgi:hypothetical protein
MPNPHRRDHDRTILDMEVIDDENPNTLTVSEIKELKRLAQMSKVARMVMAAAIGALSLFGVPAVIDFIRTHVKV